GRTKALPAGRGPAGQPGRGGRASGFRHGYVLRESSAFGRVGGEELRAAGATGVRRARGHRRGGRPAQAVRDGRAHRRADHRTGRVPFVLAARDVATNAPMEAGESLDAFRRAGRTLFSFGLVKGTEGNLSTFDGGTLVITRTGARLDSLEARDLVAGRVDGD